MKHLSRLWRFARLAWRADRRKMADWRTSAWIASKIMCDDYEGSLTYLRLRRLYPMFGDTYEMVMRSAAHEISQRGVDLVTQMTSGMSTMLLVDALVDRSSTERIVDLESLHALAAGIIEGRRRVQELSWLVRLATPPREFISHKIFGGPCPDA